VSARLAIREVAWESPPLFEPHRDAELERWARESGAPSFYPLRYFARCPWLARSMVRFSALELAHLEHELAELAVLVVSRDNSCRFCYAGARLLLRVTGMSAERIESFEAGLATAEIEPRNRLALEFVRRLSRCNPPPSRAEAQALLDAGFSREELLELSFVTAQNVVINRLTTLAALPPSRPERLDRGWVIKLLSLLGARLRRKRWIRRDAVSLSPAEKTGPFSAEVVGLDGLPAGRILRAILDEAWASPILSTRTKALAFAVAARGLGAKIMEQEALELLAAEGFDGSATEEVLAHLASPALEPVESALLPFVRETLWYEPAPLQRRARELLAELTPEQLLEGIGIASFANAVARLSRVLEVID